MMDRKVFATVSLISFILLLASVVSLFFVSHIENLQGDWHLRNLQLFSDGELTQERQLAILDGYENTIQNVLGWCKLGLYLVGAYFFGIVVCFSFSMFSLRRHRRE